MYKLSFPDVLQDKVVSTFFRPFQNPVNGYVSHLQSKLFNSFMGRIAALFSLLDVSSWLHDESAVSTSLEIAACDQQRILISNTRKAFTWTYNSQHALSAFLEYLDVQWAKIVLQWDPSQGGTLQSRCGTVVQSSCAGKSRLIDR